MSYAVRRVDDPLWKAVMEETFHYFLSFFFPDAVNSFDMDRGFDFLDKEFESLFPPQANGADTNYVDKLVKVYRKSGDEHFVLCHIEVQSSRSKTDLAERMFRYYYRITEKYKDVPITALVILADRSKTYHPKVLKREFLGTSLRYKFNTYKILDQEESLLYENTNPFAVVVLTALLAIKRADANDMELIGIKHALYAAMMARDMSTRARKGIYDFLTYYVNFKDVTHLHQFVNEIENKLGRSTTMGTRAYLLDKSKREGIEEGVEKGRRQEKEAVALALKKAGVSVSFIAEITGLSVDEVEALA